MSMREFKTILCPTDFSEESYRAIEYGLRFAEVSGGIMLIAHILHNPTTELFHPEGYVLSFEQAHGRAQAMLQELRDKRLGGFARCELLLDIGDPYEQLMAIAAQRKVDLIVTATHGRTG